MNTTLDEEFFLKPRGKVTPNLFPGEDDLVPRIEGYIEDALKQPNAITDQARFDLFVEHYVYWRTYDAALSDMLSAPSKVSFSDQGSAEWLAAQVQGIERLRDEHKEAMQAVLADVPLTANTRQVSAGVDTKFVF